MWPYQVANVFNQTFVFTSFFLIDIVNVMELDLTWNERLNTSFTVEEWEGTNKVLTTKIATNKNTEVKKKNGNVIRLYP